MFFLDNELKDLTEEKVIDNSYPYNTKNKGEIGRYAQNRLIVLGYLIIIGVAMHHLLIFFVM